MTQITQMTLIKKMSIAFAVLLWPACLSPAQVNPTGGGQVTVYATAEPPFLAGGPILVVFRVRNGTERPVRVDMGWNRESGFALQLRRGAGEWHPLPKIPMMEGLSRGPQAEISPGEKLVEPLIVNRWLELAGIGKLERGKYELEIRLSAPITGPDGASVSQVWNTRVIFDVRNASRSELEQFCERLMPPIEGRSSGVAEAFTAVAELTYVSDPVVLPFLVRAFKNQQAQIVLINRLEQRCDETAAAALERGLSGPGEACFWSRHALERISKNPACSGAALARRAFDSSAPCKIKPQGVP